HHARVIRHAAVAAGGLPKVLGNPLHLLLMLVTRKEAGCLDGCTLVVHVAKAIGLQLRLGERRMVERVEADTPRTSRNQHKGFMEADEVRDQGSGAIVEPNAHTVPITRKRGREYIVSRYYGSKFLVEAFTAHPFVIIFFTEIPEMGMASDARHIGI